MRTVQRVVDDRVFLLGLDELYREAIKPHERRELLDCARRVAGVLRVGPADVAVAGYYAEDELLTEYYRLIRSLQNIDASSTPKVDSLNEFRRLLEVASSPLYGPPDDVRKLLPRGKDALSRSLETKFPAYTVATLTEAAHREAVDTDEYSLVGLAARIQDPVVLAAVRESVALYASFFIGASHALSTPKYSWNVDEDLARQATRFIDTFNALFHEQLPPALPAQAERYWQAYDSTEIDGRCVHLAGDDSVTPMQYYHWAIRISDRGGYEVHDFWEPEIWTTSRYRSSTHRP